MGRVTLLLSSIFLIVATAFINTVESSNILFLLPIATKSHKNVFDPLIVALAERGHNVTVVAPMKFKISLPNVHELVPVPFDEINFGVSSNDPFENRKQGKLKFLLSWDARFIEEGCNKLYLNEEIQKLIRKGPGTFDVIIVNAFMNSCVLGMVHAFQAPHIYLVTMPAVNVLVSKTGAHFPPSFVPNSFVAFGDRMTFRERVINFITDRYMAILAKISWNDYFTKMYQDHLGADYPSLQEIDQNVSLILTNSHFSMSYPRPNMPDIVEVGGMHTRPAQKLPKEFNDFVSGATDGFILFSLGSIVKAKNMPVEMRTKFINVFAKLKQRVVWKWEGAVPENLPKNIMMSSWVPQQDLLGQPNLKMFITHGGMLSTQESVYHASPLIGFPLFADQDLNMKQAEKSGYALTLEINDFTEEKLEAAIQRVLTDKSMTSRAKQLSSIYRDQPHRPVETAVFWVEYIIRHKGAPHLRSAGRYLNYFAYHSIDVIAFLLAMILLALWIVWKLALTLIKCCVTFSGKRQMHQQYNKFHKNK